MLAVAAAAMFCSACEKNDGGKTENLGEPWNMTVLEPAVTIWSSLHDVSTAQLRALTRAVAESLEDGLPHMKSRPF